MWPQFCLKRHKYTEENKHKEIQHVYSAARIYCWLLTFFYFSIFSFFSLISIYYFHHILFSSTEEVQLFFKKNNVLKAKQKQVGCHLLVSHQKPLRLKFCLLEVPVPQPWVSPCLFFSLWKLHTELPTPLVSGTLPPCLMVLLLSSGLAVLCGVGGPWNSCSHQFTSLARRPVIHQLKKKKESTAFVRVPCPQHHPFLQSVRIFLSRSQFYWTSKCKTFNGSSLPLGWVSSYFFSLTFKDS